ncbi:MAG: 5-(carboxyamino)imidazole ribonucleotide synthase [Sandaracinaceae bacterium]
MRIGILGGGQLGRMLALAGHPLGHTFVVLSPDPEAPAFVAAEPIVAGYEDPEALADLAARCDVVTYEFENVPAAATDRLLALGATVRPGPEALRVSSDRRLEKELFGRLGIPTVPFAVIDSGADLDGALSAVGLPAVLKTRRFGYDGKGQRMVRQAEEAAPAFASLDGRPSILEGYCAFERELSIVAARGPGGAMACYPLVENRHVDGVLRETDAPAPRVSSAQQALAERYARDLGAALDGYVGVLALELFEREGELLANEMAPRVHNSGHWSLDGAETSQFENHLRAITGAPLGSTALRGVTRMVNVIGDPPEPGRVLAVPGAHLHLYGKAPRPGRKLGHVNVNASDPSSLSERAQALADVEAGR